MNMTSECEKEKNVRGGRHKGADLVCLWVFVTSTNFFFSPHTNCVKFCTNASIYIRIPFARSAQHNGMPNVFFACTHYNFNILFDNITDSKWCSDCNGITYKIHTSIQNNTHVWKIWQQAKIIITKKMRWNNYN